MIDITIYQQRLAWLGNYISSKIDGKLPDIASLVTIDVDIVPKISIEQIFDIYEKTGTMFFRATKSEMITICRAMNFDEYCQFKQSLK